MGSTSKQFCGGYKSWSLGGVTKMRSIRAIVRGPVLEYPWLEPGTMARVSHFAFENNTTLRFPATSDSAPGMLLWLRPSDLLARRKFLLRQPHSEFWMLALKPHRRRPNTAMLLSDPLTQSFGAMGFRFESQGELVYYLRSRQLDQTEFQICHTLELMPQV